MPQSHGFLVRDGVVMTPPGDRHMLPGVCRETVIDIALCSPQAAFVGSSQVHSNGNLAFTLQPPSHDAGHL